MYENILFHRSTTFLEGRFGLEQKKKKKKKEKRTVIVFFNEIYDFRIMSESL